MMLMEQQLQGSSHSIISWKRGGVDIQLFPTGVAVPVFYS